MNKKLVTTLNRNQLTVCTYGGFPLICYAISSGQIIGADISFLTRFAQSLGLNVVFMEKPFDGIWKLPGADICDIAAAGIMKRADRIIGPNATWSKEYFPAHRSLLVRAAEKSQFDKHFVLTNKKIIVTRGSTAEIDAKKRYANCEILFVDEVVKNELNPIEYIVKTLLATHQIDALGSGDISSIGLRDQYNDLIEGGLDVADIHPLDNLPETYSFVVRNASHNLLASLNDFIIENKQHYV